MVKRERKTEDGHHRRRLININNRKVANILSPKTQPMSPSNVYHSQLEKKRMQTIQTQNHRLLASLMEAKPTIRFENF